MECRLGEPDYWRCHSAKQMSALNRLGKQEACMPLKSTFSAISDCEPV